MTVEPETACASCGARWRLPLLLALLLSAILFSQIFGIRDLAKQGGVNNNANVAPTAETGQTVSLEVDFGDGRRGNYEPAEWHHGMTIGDLMQLASGEKFDYEVQGAGASAFLVGIQGVANEGGGGRNWTYTVNGKGGDRSFAVYELQPGDHVLWRFAASQ